MAEDRAAFIRSLFADIAQRYDLLNALLSFGLHQRCRRATAQLWLAQGGHSGAQVLDLGTGTADLALAFSRYAHVIGVDFCEPILRLGQRKVRARPGIALVLGDGLRLPFRDQSFDCVASGFVLRNLADLSVGFNEMARVTKPGGMIMALDFALPPPGWLRTAYLLYLRRWVPILGLLSQSDAYRYLADSVAHSRSPKEIVRMMETSALTRVGIHPLIGGLVAVWTGIKL